MRALDVNETQGFLDLVKLWAPFGADWRLFLEYFVKTVVKNDAGTHESFLKAWNGYCVTNKADFHNQYEFLPRPKATQDRCDDKWLRGILSQLESWLLQFRVILRLRASGLYKEFKGKRRPMIVDFQEYLFQNAGIGHPTSLFVTSFAIEGFEKPPRRDAEFFKQWGGWDAIAAEALEAILRDSEAKMREFLSVAKVGGQELVRMLNKMTDIERKEFLWFLARPNQNSDILGLVNTLLSEAVDGKAIGEIELIRRWRSKKEPNSKHVTHLHETFDDATSKLREYIAFVESQRNQASVAVNTIMAINQRGWYEFFELQLERTGSVLENLAKDDRYWLYKLQVEETYLTYALSAQRRYDRTAIQEAITFADNYYFILRLQLACAAENQNQIVGDESKEDLLNTVIPVIRKNPNNLPKLAKVYELAYDMLVNNGDRNRFMMLLREVEKESVQIPQDIKRDFYTYLINVGLRQLNPGNLEYLVEIEQIYRSTMKSGDLLRNGKIQGDHLKNIITLFTRYGQVALAKELFDSYKDKIDSSQNSFVYEYLVYMLDYFSGIHRNGENEFHQLRNGFQAIIDNSEDVLNVIDASIFQWRISYEVGDWEFIKGDKSRFSMHLKRLTSLPKAHRERYHNFRRYLVSLAFTRRKIEAIQSSPHHTKDQRVKFINLIADAGSQQKELQSGKNTVSYSWLEEEMQNLIDQAKAFNQTTVWK